jgi:hypothetical protein
MDGLEQGGGERDIGGHAASKAGGAAAVKTQLSWV